MLTQELSSENVTTDVDAASLTTMGAPYQAEVLADCEQNRLVKERNHKVYDVVN